MASSRRSSNAVLWQKTASHRPFDGLFALSSRHWPHSLCKRGKRKHTFFPSQRRPSQKTASHRPFDGLFALSSRHRPHSLCKRGKCKHTLSPSQRRPSQKTASHRPFDGLFALSSRHWPHSLCKRGKRKHTLFPSQRRPSQKTGSHRPCLDVTGHIPFASRANIHIPFRNDLRIPHLETVTTCAPVIYLARAYTAPHRLLASGTNILETLAFPRCLCSICQQRHRLCRAALALLFAAHFCLPVCASFCSAVFSTFGVSVESLFIGMNHWFGCDCWWLCKLICFGYDCWWSFVLLTWFWLLPIVYNSDLVLLVDDCLQLRFGSDCCLLFFILLWLWLLMIVHDSDVLLIADDVWMILIWLWLLMMG